MFGGFLVLVSAQRTNDYWGTTVANIPRLKERVMDIRKTRSENVWPPHDTDVGVILVAHSMGFVLSFQGRDQIDTNHL